MGWVLTTHQLGVLGVGTRTGGEERRADWSDGRRREGVRGVGGGGDVGGEAGGWLARQEGEEREGGLSEEVGGEAKGRGGPQAGVVRERERPAQGEGPAQPAHRALRHQGRRRHGQAQQGRRGDSCGREGGGHLLEECQGGGGGCSGCL